MKVAAIAARFLKSLGSGRRPYLLTGLRERLRHYLLGTISSST